VEVTVGRGVSVGGGSGVLIGLGVVVGTGGTTVGGTGVARKPHESRKITRRVKSRGRCFIQRVISNMDILGQQDNRKASCFFTDPPIRLNQSLTSSLYVHPI
jgi:hypothetical protein